MNKQNEIDLHKILVAADSATAAAAKALLDRFRPENIDSLEAFYKSSNALVTGADLASDKSIIRILKAAGVPGRILSEESETSLSSDQSLTWLVDPLCLSLIHI